jgi:hypothetical protein
MSFETIKFSDWVGRLQNFPNWLGQITVVYSNLLGIVLIHWRTEMINQLPLRCTWEDDIKPSTVFRAIRVQRAPHRVKLASTEAGKKI